MADVWEKYLFNSKILEAIDYVESISKEKPANERILKYMARSNLELQEEVLQMLRENLGEEGILENRGDDLNQCFYLKESIESYTKKREKETEIIDLREDDTPGTLILEMLTPLPNKNISDDIKESDDFFDRHASTCLNPKNNNENNVSIPVYKQLLFSQEEQIKSQRKSIFYFEKNWKVSKGH